jgi:putative phage-type endonuclease
MALTEAQLEERRSGVGGSDAAVVLNLNPFKDIYELYLDKRGEAPAEDPEFLKESRYWGSVLEEPVANRYAEETGYKIQRSNQLLRSKEHPHMIANIDRRVVGQDMRIGFEAKTQAYPDGWGDSGSDVIPPYIMLQCQHYLAVTEWDFWDLAVLIGNRDYRQYRIARVEDIIEQLIDAETEFWDRVQTGVPPEPDWQSAATTRMIKRLYPGTNGEVIELPEVAQSYHDVAKDAAQQRLMFEKVEQGCKNRIGMMMGDNAIGILPDGSVYVRKEVTRKEYTVAETSYMQMSHTTRVPKKASEAIEQGTVKKLESKS